MVWPTLVLPAGRRMAAATPCAEEVADVRPASDGTVVAELDRDYEGTTNNAHCNKGDHSPSLHCQMCWQRALQSAAATERELHYRYHACSTAGHCARKCGARSSRHALHYRRLRKLRTQMYTHGIIWKLPAGKSGTHGDGHIAGGGEHALEQRTSHGAYAPQAYGYGRWLGGGTRPCRVRPCQNQAPTPPGSLAISAARVHSGLEAPPRIYQAREGTISVSHAMKGLSQPLASSDSFRGHAAVQHRC